jgi:hypothetical protein
MDPASQYYKDLFYLLKTFGIENLRDLDGIQPDTAWGYSSYAFGWVTELFEFVKDNGPSVLSCITDSVPIRIFLNDMRRAQPGKVRDEIHVRANYACLFPRRVTFLSDVFTEWIQGGRKLYTIPDSFLSQALILKPLLLGRQVVRQTDLSGLRQGASSPGQTGALHDDQPLLTSGECIG